MELLWDWRSIGSLLATMMFLRTAVRDFLPQEVQFFLRSLFARIFSNLRPTNTIIIDEYDSASSNTNDLFNAAHIYLSSRCLATAPVLRLSKPRNCRTLTSSLPASHTATDSFAGITLRWRFQSIDRPPTSLSTSSFSPGASTPEHRYYELSFDRRHRDAVQAHYIPHVLNEAERIRFKSRERRLYTNRSIAGSVFDGNHGGIGNHLWSSVPFAHPSTFDTIAIDSALRDDIRADLLRFTASRDYYSRVGRAWKRGYLLHGPPGTGKTSLIAAIANFLEFDVYDIELTAVTSNSHLRKLLVSTTSKSVIVIEDVDCTLDLSDRKKRNHNHPSFNIVHPNAELGFNEVGVVGFGVGLPQIPFSGAGAGAGASASASGNSGTAVSLSGVLNFVDGLWSSCVGERLMVFTTNHPERLDPALLRPGRMDRQIHLSYCGPEAFRTLAKNYLAVEGHELMAEVEQLLGEARITPAEVAELLMGCDGDGTDIGMRKVLEEMRRRKAPPPPLRPHPNVAPTETSAVSLLYGGTMQTKDGLYKLLV